jgi:hypothetical protein
MSDAGHPVRDPADSCAVAPDASASRRARIVSSSGARAVRRRLVASSPALMTLVASLVLLASTHTQDVHGYYDREASAALIAGDYERARICFERLLQYAPENERYREGLAAALQGISTATASRAPASKPS